MILTRDAILAIDDLKTERVEVPEWGGEVFVRTMTGAERDAFEASLVIGRGKNAHTNYDNFRAKLVAYTVCDEAGTLLFTPEDVTALGKKSAAALVRLANVSAELNGITEEDVEELAGNSGSAPNGASGSS